MSTKLDQLLRSLSFERTLDDVDRLTDEALNTLPIREARLKEWETFQDRMILCLRHVEDHVLRRSPAGAARRADREFEWARCVEVLRRLHGPNGEKTAFDVARTGIDGGLYRLVQDVAQRVAEGLVQNEVRAKVTNWWIELSTSERVAVAEEYLAKYHCLLPLELMEGNAARLRGNMPQMLEQHPGLMQQFAQVGRR